MSVRSLGAPQEHEEATLLPKNEHLYIGCTHFVQRQGKKAREVIDTIAGPAPDEETFKKTLKESWKTRREEDGWKRGVFSIHRIPDVTVRKIAGRLPDE